MMILRPSLAFIRLLALASLALPTVAQSTILVPAGQPTIQAGIAAAVDGDTVLVAPGTYVEQIDLLGKAITVRSEGGAAVTTIDSQGASAWPDFPEGAVVRMIAGESAATVLQGFTITGANDTTGFYVGTSGIWCDALQPTIRDCVVRDNNGPIGAGIFGSPIIEGCEISGNSSMPYGDGGGVYGAPSITGSVIANNRSGGFGGGVFANAVCTITDSVIDGNVAGNGSDGYSGGGVFGPALLERCRITNNSAHHWFSGGPPDEIGTAVDGALSLVSCTVSGNTIVGGAVSGDLSGALRDVGSVSSSIIWDNENLPFSDSTNPTVTYSIVTGGYAGVGNLASDPLFVDPVGGDFSLQLGSPAIDAGDPALPLDPDGTVADMGPYPFFQATASATVTNGSGVNPLSYQPVSAPVSGTTWTATLDASLHAGAPTLAAVYGVLSPGAPIPTGFGELLLNPFAVTVLSQAAPVAGTLATFSVAIPPNPAYLGVEVYTQALAVTSTLEFANAIELVIGI